MPLFYDLPFADYQAINALNWSRLKRLATSPLHYLTNAQTKSAPAFSAMHAAVLEPERFAADYAVYDGVRRGKEYDRAVAENPGRVLLSPSEDEQIAGVAAAVRRHPVAAALLAEGRAEVTITWDVPGADGDKRHCKGRIDWLTNGGGIVDLKAVPSVAPRQMAVEIARRLYHGQLAWYARGLEQVTGQRPACFILAYEAKAPYDVGVYRLDADGALYVGETLVDRMLAQLTACESAGHWPGQAPDMADVALPRWAAGIDEEPEEGQGDDFLDD